MDLIGHFRIAHQESQEEALICPNRTSSHNALMPDSSDLDAVISSGCQAKFTSQRLLDSHLLSTADGMMMMSPASSAWACPLSLDAELVQAMAVIGTATEAFPVTEFDSVVLATEIAADAAGQMILAYGCPICSRVFTGDNCTARFVVNKC